MSSTGIPEFFEGLAKHLIATVQPQAIMRMPAEGDVVTYHGSKEADHGLWLVRSTDPARRSVTLYRPGVARGLEVRPTSVTVETDVDLTHAIWTMTS